MTRHTRRPARLNPFAETALFIVMMFIVLAMVLFVMGCSRAEPIGLLAPTPLNAAQQWAAQHAYEVCLAMEPDGAPQLWPIASDWRHAPGQLAPISYCNPAE